MNLNAALTPPECIKSDVKFQVQILHMLSAVQVFVHLRALRQQHQIV